MCTSPQLLAVGSSKGVLTLFSVKSVSGSGAVLECTTSFTAHPPQKNNEDMRFGQLSKQSVSVIHDALKNSEICMHVVYNFTLRHYSVVNTCIHVTMYVYTCMAVFIFLRAEIWSLCWSPNDSQVATCSEDQTTKIWNATQWTW